MKCPYCNHDAELVTGAVVYPRLPWLHEKLFYSCLPCNAYVGCHDGTVRPLGRLANAELRAVRMAAHAALDPIWKSRQLTRTAALPLAGKGAASRDNGLPR
jgi:hypothetical protein